MRNYSRRTVLRGAVLQGAVGTLTAFGLSGSQQVRAQAPVTPGPDGERQRAIATALGELHEQIAKILVEHRIVGGAVAALHRGELVFDHGYGLADPGAGKPVTPQTLFSLASVSKPITGIGTLLLVQDGKLNLDARVVDVLRNLRPLRGQQIADPRFREITVHQLLFHGGGLIHDAPEVNDATHGEAFDRLDCENRYRALMSKPLRCDPGTESHYSNAGFLVLRVIIEHVTGQEYEPFIHEHVLGPMGIQRMHLEHGNHYGPDETHRFRANQQPAERTLANWLASAGAIARFAAAVAGSGGRPPFLNPQMTEQMFAMPASLKVQRPQGPHVGLGWDTVLAFPDGRYRFSKNGGKAGVQAWLEHLENDVAWSVLLNTDSPEKETPKPVGQIRKAALEVFERIYGVRAE